jgi:aminopeptidase N
MENWGYVIYDDKYLTRDQSDISVFDTERIAKIVTHELAHQWFGDLVTMAWWDSPWLDDFFAGRASFNSMVKMLPDWDAWPGGRPGGGRVGNSTIEVHCAPLYTVLS